MGRGTKDEDAASDRRAPPPARKRYETPRLLHLGSVRELTLGGSAGIAEGAGTFVMAM